MTGEQYLSAAQLCEKFGNISKRTLLRWQEKRNFPAPTISYRGGANLWTLSDVLESEISLKKQDKAQQSLEA